jgi:hypothetical protein
MVLTSYLPPVLSVLHYRYSICPVTVKYCTISPNDNFFLCWHFDERVI